MMNLYFFLVSYDKNDYFCAMQHFWANPVEWIHFRFLVILHDFFLSKNLFNKIDKKRYDHCMAYTAPDATKTKTLGTTYDQQ